MDPLVCGSRWLWSRLSHRYVLPQVSNHHSTSAACFLEHIYLFLQCLRVRGFIGRSSGGVQEVLEDTRLVLLLRLQNASGGTFL